MSDSSGQWHLLLVDDEPRVVQGLQRTLSLLLDNWRISLATGGEEALRILEIQPVDLVVSDLRMPNMDGAEFLREVQQRHPQTIRFILSGHADKDLVLKATPFVHQFLTKPCDATALASAIQEAHQSSEAIARANLKKLVSQLPQLPAMPNVLQELLETLQNPQTTLDAVVKIIMKDPSIVSKIMQISNSAFFGMSGRVNSVEEAVSVLGADIIKGLVLVGKVFQQIHFQPIESFSMQDLWDHSLKVAMVSKRIGTTLKVSPQKIQEAFTASLLHDIGKLVFASGLGAEYGEALKRSRQERIALWEVEKDMFGNSHAELGGYLFQIWGLPVSVVEAIRWHHHPQRVQGAGINALTILHIANSFAHYERDDISIYTPGKLDEDYMHRLALSCDMGKYEDAVEKEQS